MVAHTLPSDLAPPAQTETPASWAGRLQRAWPLTLLVALPTVFWEAVSPPVLPPWLLVLSSAILGAVLALSAVGLHRSLAQRRAAPRAGANEALDALKRLDTYMLDQLRRATGLSETSALNMIERVAGLRALSARLMGYLSTAHAQSTQMQAEIERNGSIIAEMAGFVKQLPQQISHERAYLSQLVTDVRQLSGITETIRLMARQTEILSINAAIAAARAGEAGRGFSVLAGEVRRLAQQSNQAAQEIEQNIARLVDTVQMRTEGVFAQQLQSNEDEAARLLALTGKLDEGYLDMRQFYAMLLTAITEHNGALDHGITHLLDTAQYQDVFKQIVDRLHPAFRARDEVVEQWIGSLQGGQENLQTIEARARELPDQYLNAEALHRDPEAMADGAPGDPGQRIELF